MTQTVQVDYEKLERRALAARYGLEDDRPTRAIKTWVQNELDFIDCCEGLTKSTLSDTAAALVYVAAAVLSALPACYFLGGAYGWFAGDCAFTLVTLAVVLASAYLDGHP